MLSFRQRCILPWRYNRQHCLVRSVSGCICGVIILCVVFATQDFRIKEKNGANLFISSKYFTRAFFILASSKLCTLFSNHLYKTIILPTLAITIPNSETFLFCQHNSTEFRIETDYTYKFDSSQWRRKELEFGLVSKTSSNAMKRKN
jgi:hypothetical protein